MGIVIGNDNYVQYNKKNYFIRFIGACKADWHHSDVRVGVSGGPADAVRPHLECVRDVHVVLHLRRGQPCGGAAGAHFCARDHGEERRGNRAVASREKVK